MSLHARNFKQTPEKEVNLGLTLSWQEFDSERGHHRLLRVRQFDVRGHSREVTLNRKDLEAIKHFAGL